MRWMLPLLLLPMLVIAQPGGLPANEKLSYTIEWRLITAGKAVLARSPAPNREGSQVNMRVESAGLVSKLFRVEDTYDATLNQNNCAESIHIVAHEGSRRRDTRISFDGGGRKANYLERDQAKNSVVLAQETDIPPCVYDVIGGVFHMRTLNIEPGQSVTVPVSDGKKSVMARIEAQQREEVKTPAGTFRTVRYEVYLFNNVLYRRNAHLYVWLSDDRARLPVQFKVRLQFTIGTITLLLDKHE
jgi:hypothetical protein